MAYVAPTVAEFKARFPTVAAGKSDETIQAYLDEAATQVDTSWREVDYKPAIMYLAAHMMVSEANAAAGGSGGGVSSGAVASESFGGMSISYENNSAANDAASQSQWGGTEYGRSFYNLLKKNKPAVVVI